MTLKIPEHEHSWVILTETHASVIVDEQGKPVVFANETPSEVVGCEICDIPLVEVYQK